jgi:hypothetical protein
MEALLLLGGNQGDRLHILELTQNLTYGTSINIVPIDSTKFAKRIAEVPTGDSIFEFDMFISPNNDLFYVIWDYTKLAVVYMSIDEKDLPDNINIFECKYVGNLKLDEQISENLIEVEQ